MPDRIAAAVKKAAQATGHKAAPARKPRREQSASAPSTPQAGRQPKIRDLNVRSQIEKGIAELQGLHKLLLSSEVDQDVLEDFRDALNRVRNTAWAAQQYVIRKESDEDSTSVISLLAGERLRAAYHLCQALVDDLKGTEIEFQRGSLAQLYEVTNILNEQLKRVIGKI